MALYDLIEKYKAKEFQEVKIVTLFGTAPAQYMTSTPVKTLADLKGMELRVPGTSADVVKAMGAVPIAMPQSDVPEALQKGVVKGQVTAVEVLKDFNYAAYTPYVTMTNLYVVTFAVVMNKSKWASLPKDVQKVIDDLGREQALWTGKYEDDHCLEALQWSKEKYKLQIFELPANEQAEIPKLMAPIIDSYAKRVTSAGLPGEQIVKDALALKEKYNKEFK
jgi:TRAP-type C4-dicarboxylate transport system substrate-binding protein